MTSGQSVTPIKGEKTSIEDVKERLRGFEGFIEEQMARTKVPGLAMAIVKDNEVIFSQGFGYRDVEKKLPVTEHTLFMIASVTKSFTAASVGLLVDEGKVDWDTPVQKYLPQFRMYDEVASLRLTPRDLGCHRSGLPRHDMSWAGASMTPEEMLNRIPYLRPTRDIRSAWQYQNLMYATLGFMVGRIAECSWEEFVQKRILNPLGMNDTVFKPEEAKENPMYANCYTLKNQTLSELGYVNLNSEATGPAGVMISSTADLVEWVRLHLNQGRSKNEVILSEKTVTEMHTPHMIANNRAKMYPEMPIQSYGLGWFVETYRGHKVIHHGGNLPGFHSLVTMMPDEGIGMVLLTNLDGNFLPSVLSWNVYDRILGLDAIDWISRFEQDREVMKAKVDDANHKMSAAKQEGTSTSQALSRFTGVYEHGGYGKLTVDCDNGVLLIQYNGQKMNCTHYHYDQFLWESPGLLGKVVARFLTGRDGGIEALSVPFEPTDGAEEILFQRIG